MPPGQQVKVHKSASFVDILEVCKFTTFCDRKVVSRASRTFPACTHARMTSGFPRPLVIRACVHVGKIRLYYSPRDYLSVTKCCKFTHFQNVYKTCTFVYFVYITQGFGAALILPEDTGVLSQLIAAALLGLKPADPSGGS